MATSVRLNHHRGAPPPIKTRPAPAITFSPVVNEPPSARRGTTEPMTNVAPAMAAMAPVQYQRAVPVLTSRVTDDALAGSEKAADVVTPAPVMRKSASRGN